MNRRSRARLAYIPLALALAIALPGTVLAATVSDTYTIRGAEYYATSTQGRFGGTARATPATRRRGRQRSTTRRSPTRPISPAARPVWSHRAWLSSKASSPMET